VPDPPCTVRSLDKQRPLNWVLTFRLERCVRDFDNAGDRRTRKQELLRKEIDRKVSLLAY
jgi:hypothetical protein